MLRRRGDIWHYDFTINGDRYRGSTGFQGKRDAQAFEDRERRRIQLGEARAVPTLGEVASEWFAARMDGRRSQVTTADCLNVAMRLLGPDTPINAIGSREIAGAMQVRRFETTRQGKTPANATVNRNLIDSTMRPILNYAERVLEVPVRKVDWRSIRLPEPKGRSRAFTPAEIAAFRQALPEWHRPVFDFTSRYGVRLKEAFFPPDAVDPVNMEVTIRRRKNGLPVVAELTPEDAADLAARASRATAAGLSTVWYRDHKGKLTPIVWRGFQSACQRALMLTNMTDARPVHDLRHHAGTAILRDTGNLAMVQALLGHENIASSARYAHVAKGAVRAALRHTTVTNAPEEAANPTPTRGRTGT